MTQTRRRRSSSPKGILDHSKEAAQASPSTSILVFSIAMINRRHVLLRFGCSLPLLVVAVAAVFHFKQQMDWTRRRTEAILFDEALKYEASVKKQREVHSVEKIVLISDGGHWTRQQRGVGRELRGRPTPPRIYDRQTLVAEN